MTDRRWKQIERLVAAAYGATRIALSGGNNTQGKTRSDTDHAALFVETKHGQRWAGFGTLWKATAGLARLEGKVPVLVIHPTRSPAVACIDSDPEAEERPRPRQRNLAGEPVADDIVVEDVQGSPGKLFSAANYELRVAVDDLEEFQKQGSGSREARLELMKKVKARKKALLLTPEVYGRESGRLLDRAFNEAL